MKKLNLEEYLHSNAKVEPMTIFERYNIPIEIDETMPLNQTKLIDPITGENLLDIIFR